ncbi:hypothetical protein V1511DRAFT_471996, partial [Dipodascopsis uninucleata]
MDNRLPLSIADYASPSNERSAGSSEEAPATGLSSPVGRQSSLYRRSYKACLHCRERKVRCDLGSLDNPSEPPCARCKREGRKCEFVPSRRGGAKNVRAGRTLQLSASLLNDDSRSPVSASVSSDSGSDSISGQPSSSSSRRHREDGTKQIAGSLIRDRGLHTTADALNILAHVANTAEGKDRGSQFVQVNGNDQSGALPAKRAKTREVHSRWMFRSTKLSFFLPVQQGIITEKEVLVLTEFFFKTLHPFYPYIPPGLQSPNNLAAHPMLLVTILAIASRYCDVPEVDTSSHPGTRTKQIHDAIWTFCQSMISQTVWAEASSISLATVLAFLLLTQWNPRAVHYRNGDYANPINLPSNDEDGRGPEGGGGYGGFAAARRSDRMAWMMVGVAVRLAQDMNLFCKWREICLACFYSDITLALRLGRPSMMSYNFQETPLVTFSSLDNAKLEILRIQSFAHQSLYSSPGSMHKILNSDNYQPLLRYFRSKLRSWHTKYQLLLQREDLEREILLFEFYHTELYIYSLALSPRGHRQTDESFAELYILFAIQAAHQMICLIRRIHKGGTLKYASVNWFIRAVHAAVFLAKVFVLDRDRSLEEQQELISSIRGLANTLQDASPDNIHLSVKYAEALFNLADQLESEFSKHNSVPSDQMNEKNVQDSVRQIPDGLMSIGENSLKGVVQTQSVMKPLSQSEQSAAINDCSVADDQPAFTNSAMLDNDSIKWFVDAYGIGFDGNYALDQDIWFVPDTDVLMNSEAALSASAAS